MRYSLLLSWRTMPLVTARRAALVAPAVFEQLPRGSAPPPRPSRITMARWSGELCRALRQQHLDNVLETSLLAVALPQPWAMSGPARRSAPRRATPRRARGRRW